MTMQRRHFELIAETIAELPTSNSEERNNRFNIAQAFARKLRATNPNFNEARFLRACGVTDA